MFHYRYRRPRTVAMLVLGLALAIVPIDLQAQQQKRAQDPSNDQGTAEQIGEQIDQILRDLQKNFEGLSGEVRQRFAEARQRVENLGVEARVYGRLHWDKALYDADIALEIQEDHTVVLHGSVDTAEDRRQAVKLAVETVGVERVIDRLTVVTPAPENDQSGENARTPQR